MSTLKGREVQSFNQEPSSPSTYAGNAMAQKVNQQMLHEIGLNPFAANLLVDSYSKLMADNIGKVGAVEFELGGVVVSLRHPNHTKLVEGMPTGLIQAGIVQRLMQCAEEGNNLLNLIERGTPDHKLKSKVEKVLKRLSLCHRAIVDNNPEFIRLPSPEDLGYEDNVVHLGLDGSNEDHNVQPSEPSSKFDQGSKRDEDLVNTHLWRNSEGNPIPDWLQGRGVGIAGGTLHVTDNAGEIITVQPNQLILYRMGTKDVYLREEPDA